MQFPKLDWVEIKMQIGSRYDLYNKMSYRKTKLNGSVLQ